MPSAQGGLTIQLVEKYNHVPQVSLSVYNAVRQVNSWAANTAVELMRRSMGGPGPNPPSAPGQPPHRQTDELYNSLKAVLIDDTTAGVEMAEHGELLENGTANMAPRPFITPAMEQIRDKYASQMRRALLHSLPPYRYNQNASRFINSKGQFVSAR